MRIRYWRWTWLLTSGHRDRYYRRSGRVRHRYPSARSCWYSIAGVDWPIVRVLVCGRNAFVRLLFLDPIWGFPRRSNGVHELTLILPSWMPFNKYYVYRSVECMRTLNCAQMVVLMQRTVKVGAPSIARAINPVTPKLWGQSRVYVQISCFLFHGSTSLCRIFGLVTNMSIWKCC